MLLTPTAHFCIPNCLKKITNQKKVSRTNLLSGKLPFLHLWIFIQEHQHSPLSFY